MSRGPQLFLSDILESIAAIREYTEHTSKEGFMRSRTMQDAVIRRLGINGEAAGRIPREMQISYPAIPWRPISAMRNRLIHEYGRVDLELTWEVVQRELPILEEQVKTMLADFV
ncbi:MAG: DUF86 domain-containing protein [Chloroflexi bacterium]|nr:DUF86 domain-containing protein [Chloroflexota bacterium]